MTNVTCHVTSSNALPNLFWKLVDLVKLLRLQAPNSISLDHLCWAAVWGFQRHKYPQFICKFYFKYMRKVFLALIFDCLTLTAFCGIIAWVFVSHRTPPIMNSHPRILVTSTTIPKPSRHTFQTIAPRYTSLPRARALRILPRTSNRSSLAPVHPASFVPRSFVTCYCPLCFVLLLLWSLLSCWLCRKPANEKKWTHRRVVRYVLRRRWG